MELQPPRMLKTMSGSLRSQEEVLLEPFNYIGKLPGKGIRPRMIAAFNNWLQVPSEIIEKIADITQKLHNASLVEEEEEEEEGAGAEGEEEEAWEEAEGERQMIDDIEDNSKLRRGTPVAHVVYGVPQTLNTANYVYFLALNDLTKLGNSQAVEIFIKEMLNLHRGQVRENAARLDLTRV
ncbi:hypothetical protein GUITHDRAFT_147398 [Guillardia theta CCMP2712]|uniref:Uncharacterized protein n=1 Tax=Guillardia theta (strain CCMP2712) TaxID=905079 RepID=L1IDN4_GUITC|nr:hypothetical protein GUITHDRAFT_147398 [Guillardia theta CCMP2712]EKX34217.1 hypothetical protein GUITHDRAFT_147398 [Guillardia theta CCMP2712]|eukprot:XP_005821197.1 hypothetical protein GUITHDRAFT_147398 [Guillardia theta CCMP2712]